MRKKIINILILAVIIAGITGVWFIKNRNASGDIDNFDNAIREKREEVIENKIEKVIDMKIENIDNEEEPSKSEMIEGANEVEKSTEQVIIDKDDLNFDLSTPSFDVETLKSYGLPVLLDFGASWCAPCKRMHPVLEELNSELRGKAIIKYVDIDVYPEATKGFDFSLIPTQYFVTADGEVYKTHTGIISKEDVIEILKEMGMKE